MQFQSLYVLGNCFSTIFFIRFVVCDHCDTPLSTVWGAKEEKTDGLSRSLKVHKPDLFLQLTFFRAKFNLYFHTPFKITNTNLGATETQVLSSAAAMLHEDPSCCRGSTVIDRVILRNFRDDSEFERISRGCHFVNSSVTNVSVFTSFSPKWSVFRSPEISVLLFFYFSLRQSHIAGKTLNPMFLLPPPS